MVYKYDFLVIGAGVAGMSYALKVARANKGRVCMICKTSLDEANTSFAQGGVASVTNLELDNFEKHIEDTMIAGDYISDPKAVEQVVRMAPEQIRELVNWGVNFDKASDGKFDLHREGGHSEFRILHHKDDTGAEIQRGLMEAVRNNPNIDIKEDHFAVEIITQHHLGVRVTRRSPLSQPLIPSSLLVMVSPWYIAPKEQWLTWSLFSSTLPFSTIPKRLTLLISSPRPCVATAAS